LERLRLIQRALRYRYSHDPCEIRAMLERVPRGGTAIDIGAHKGAYTWWLCRKVGSGGRVVSVEPQAELADRLERLFAKTGQQTLFRGAVSDRTGTGELVVPEAGPSHGASLRGIEPGERGRVTTVETTTLDDLAASMNLGRVDFIKCDAEGHEHAIFRGGAALLGRDRPGVLVECDRGFVAGDPVGELWAMFEPLGYEGWVVFRDRLVPIAEFDYGVHQKPDRAKHDHGHNFLFAHPTREP
jgi:FkbM family methyltransferase